MMVKQAILQRIRALTSPIAPVAFHHPTNLITLRNITVVAFDFYGTMFISGVGDIGVDEEQKQAYRQTFKTALKNTGFTHAHASAATQGLHLFEKTINCYQHDQQAKGIDYPEPNIMAVWQQVLQQMKEKELIYAPLTDQKITRFAIEYEFGVNNIWPVPKLTSLLKKIRSSGRHLGIISNSQFYTPLAFEALTGSSTGAFGFDHDLQIWSYQQGVKKPARSFYQSFVDALDAKNIAPQEVLYVGNDLFKDVIPASLLGMYTGLYVGDRRSVRHSHRELTACQHQPDIIIDDLCQVLECLN